MVELVDTVNPTQYQDASFKGLSFHQLGAKGWEITGHSGKVVSGTLERDELVIPELKIIVMEVLVRPL
ncbi:MAG: hypothetical protein ACKVJE_17865 [Pseudomonadales bacterium]